jgi:hypothetical protein
MKNCRTGPRCDRFAIICARILAGLFQKTALLRRTGAGRALWLKTSLLRSKRDQWGRRPGAGELAVAAVQRLFGQVPGEGCLPTLYAATATGIRGGEYIAPGGPGHKRGRPAPAQPPRRALDPGTAGRLWEASARLTGVSFSPLAPASR